jgi:hypothetical protein
MTSPLNSKLRNDWILLKAAFLKFSDVLFIKHEETIDVWQILCVLFPEWPNAALPPNHFRRTRSVDRLTRLTFAI